MIKESILFVIEVKEGKQMKNPPNSLSHSHPSSTQRAPWLVYRIDGMAGRFPLPSHTSHTSDAASAAFSGTTA